MRGGLTFQKLTKTQLIYSVSCFNLGGLELCLGGLSPQKLPRGDGAECHCLAALPAKVSVFSSHMHGSHSVISNKPRFSHQKIHICTITPFWTRKKLILITVTKNIQNCERICLMWKTSCTLLFQILKLHFTYTCASWFPTVLESFF